MKSPKGRRCHFLIINATTQRVFERLCKAMGQPELVQDPQFKERADRAENHAAIHEIIAAWVRTLPLEQCQAELDAAGVPATKVYATSDIVADPHYAAREQVLRVEADGIGELLQPGIVPRLTETPGRVTHRAPRLGEHNREVYMGLLGLDAGEYETLRAEGVI